MRDAADAPRVHLVATAGSGEGRGHLSRALALGEELRGREIGVDLELVRGRPSTSEAAAIAELGIGERLLAARDVLVIDLPDAGRDAQGDRHPADRTVVFDDGDRYRGDAAVVVQPSLPAWSGGTSGTGRQVLEGYAYAPLRQAVGAAARRVLGGEAARPPRLLVCFGGSDPWRLTERFAPVVARHGAWETTIVVGPDYRGDAGGSRKVLRDPTDLVALLAAADVAVLGAGTMKFEAACLGVPTVLVAAADDQLSTGPAFAGTGAAAYLGEGREVEPAALASTVAALLDDAPRRAAMSARGREVVDGLGAARIADVIERLVRSA